MRNKRNLPCDIPIPLSAKEAENAHKGLAIALEQEKAVLCQGTHLSTRIDERTIVLHNPKTDRLERIKNKV